YPLRQNISIYLIKTGLVGQRSLKSLPFRYSHEYIYNRKREKDGRGEERRGKTSAVKGMIEHEESKGGERLERLFYHLFRVPEFSPDVKGEKRKILSPSRRSSRVNTILAVGDTILFMDASPSTNRYHGDRHYYKKNPYVGE
ncbi:MAG TPA: hypothetical protein VFN23_04610, partial [Ktedonobacteraceae bacterium]|nr:hypothetical protein [Ktedonobacteraceae bacterium]